MRARRRLTRVLLAAGGLLGGLLLWRLAHRPPTPSLPGLTNGRAIGGVAVQRDFVTSPVEFGRVLTESKTRLSIQLTNTGDKAVSVTSTSTSCGCTAVALTATTVSPGSSTTLVVDYSAPPSPKFVTTTVTLSLRSEGMEWEQPVLLAGEVVPMLTVYHDGAWDGSPSPVDLGTFAIGDVIEVSLQRGDRAPVWTSFSATNAEGDDLLASAKSFGIWSVQLPIDNPEYSGARVVPVDIRLGVAGTRAEFTIRRVFRYELESVAVASPPTVYIGRAVAGGTAECQVDLVFDSAIPDRPLMRGEALPHVFLATQPDVEIPVQTKLVDGTLELKIRCPVPTSVGSHTDALLIKSEGFAVRVPIRLLVIEPNAP